MKPVEKNNGTIPKQSAFLNNYDYGTKMYYGENCGKNLWYYGKNYNKRL